MKLFVYVLIERSEDHLLTYTFVKHAAANVGLHCKHTGCEVSQQGLEKATSFFYAIVVKEKAIADKRLDSLPSAPSRADRAAL